MNVAAYFRVSGDQQVEAQRSIVRDYCERESFSLVAEYSDQGVSGSTVFEGRPAGAEILEAARRRDFARIVVSRLDRLSSDPYEAARAATLLREQEVDVVAVSDSFDDSPAGEMLASLVTAFAQHGARIIAERLHQRGGME